MKKIIFIGAGGHGKSCAEVAGLNGYEEIAFLDDSFEALVDYPYPVLGATDDADKYSDADFFVSVGNAKVRERIQNSLEEKHYRIATLIHPKTVIPKVNSIGAGTLVNAGTIMNPYTTIGKGCIINTAATIGHDCTIGDFVHVSAGVHVAGTVEIGKRSWIGIGSTVSNNLTICEDCMIGAGAVVVNDITEAGTYFGVPARCYKKSQEIAETQERVEEGADAGVQDDVAAKVREKILSLCQSVDDSLDYTEEGLVTNSILDSVTMISIVAELEEGFGIEIDYKDVKPENFDSLDAMCRLVRKYV